MCTPPNTVGSLDHDEMIITADQTYILAGYTVQCEGIVTTWEFCYQITGTSSVTFYPGIWEIARTSDDNTTYSLIQSNNITFDPTSGSCQNYTLPETEQFTAPSELVVGLYSNSFVLLLHTNNDSQISTYRFTDNQSSVVGGPDQDVNYNIAIRVHLGEWPFNKCIYLNDLIQIMTTEYLKLYHGT